MESDQTTSKASDIISKSIDGCRSVEVDGPGVSVVGS